MGTSPVNPRSATLSETVPARAMSSDWMAARSSRLDMTSVRFSVMRTPREKMTSAPMTSMRVKPFRRVIGTPPGTSPSR